MYNIIDQSKQINMSLLLNGTNSNSTTASGAKFDCAKECPCGVPAIPVPDQWLEVMVTGRFKVWHIIFIIIAFVVTLVVVYCCFHRCRIPRTKQEIEADLMRTNLASKFRDYLQEFPNEPTTFLEALKRVQDLEEKSSEQDDPGARKRMGWLKLKGKEKREKGDDKSGADKTSRNPEGGAKQSETDKDPTVVAEGVDAAPGTCGDKGLSAVEPLVSSTEQTEQPAKELKPIDFAMKTSSERAKQGPEAIKPSDSSTKSKLVAPSKEKKTKGKEAKLIKTKGEKVLDDGEPVSAPPPLQVAKVNTEKKPVASTKSAAPVDAASTGTSKPARARRRRDKPNLLRAEATVNPGSLENQNQLSLPAISHHHHHHQHQKNPKEQSVPSETHKHKAEDDKPAAKKERKQAKAPKSKSPTGRTKPKATKESTVITIEPTKLADLNPS